MSHPVNPHFVSWLEQHCQANAIETSLIQTLWSGYGACFRAALQPARNSHLAAPLSAVVKCAVTPATHKHPRGWNGDTGHNRKLRSFAIENSFYQYAQPFTNERCKTPRCIAAAKDGDSTLLVMEDLGKLGFTQTTLGLTVAQAEVVLTWLAEFHSRFIHTKSYFQTNNVLLWDTGTYWHLKTREDEYQAMTPCQLKDSASKIDSVLNNAKYQTLVHGDAKVANFCFTPDFQSCAAVDFQYVGFGVGVKDVAYFLGSALSEDDQVTYSEHCLEVYFKALALALHQRCSVGSQAYESAPPTALEKSEIPLLIKEWRTLYPIACADFHRFLAGWSPQHWKIDKALQHQTSIALSMLKGSSS
ncbi:oxidoreductase family protein [Alteromonas sp.]|uniref:oxidoreductase family protein n=1 Tax=Alteromonas sp. TaxID=232 RepID=UPI000B69E64A|nr:oxidoreductase family protein [Alteromonas sp.]MAI39436.1 hypothetical protein [Alteromonas sp.]OUX83731.1 MAG: hypothetical protein CBB95_18030 [Alteromonas sp. TMED35]|tara:strand:+ start:11414 stop:12490 length:1077 start_codon:yes stop_codon:yes gene_type:complete